MDALAHLLNALRISEYSAYSNAQIKTYPDGSAVVTVFDKAIIRRPGLELARDQEPEEEGPEEGPDTPISDKKKAANVARSKRRAKAAVYDLARATDFEFFTTLTISKDKVKDRLDDAEVFKHLQDWLDNNVRRHGLAYVLVPEYHKKGGLHFHAFFNDALEVVDSGTISLPGGGKPKRPRSKAQRAAWLAQGGHVVYNLPGWGWGFTTAIRLYGERDAAIGYVVKYITKSDEKIGGRWYYSGGPLLRPAVQVENLDFERATELIKASKLIRESELVKAYELGDMYEIQEIGCKGVRLRIRTEEYNETLEKLRGTAGHFQRPEDEMAGTCGRPGGNGSID